MVNYKILRILVVIAQSAERRISSWEVGFFRRIVIPVVKVCTEAGHGSIEFALALIAD
jgi:hypothetical protein